LLNSKQWGEWTGKGGREKNLRKEKVSSCEAESESTGSGREALQSRRLWQTRIRLNVDQTN
jgi:hypothetical protein